MPKLGFTLALVITLLIAASSLAVAQTSKGFVVGNVTDPNGASVAGANVKVTNKATGVTRETKTQSDGSYRIEALDPGTYRVDISGAGFKSETKDNVAVTASQSTDLPFQLQVGTAAETVVVTSDSGAIELQNQDGARVNTLDRRQITDLPILGLNPVNLVFTLPGVIDAGATQSGGFVQGTEFSINGIRARGNNQLIDGLDNNDNAITGQFIQPTLRDGYQEVTILGSDYSSEYGRAGGAVVNVITRSGTNSFHGSGYDIVTPSKFFSLTPGQKSIQGLTKVPHSIDNTFGFSLGGPIKKNKLFFFGTLQIDLTRQNAVSTVNIPTPAGLAQLRALFPQGASVNLDQYLAIVGPTIPLSNCNSANGCQSIPLGGGRPSIEFGQASIVSPQPSNDYQSLGRVDWTPTTKDSFAFRYIVDKNTVTNQFPGITFFPGFEVDSPALVQNQLISYTRNLSPRTTNEFRFGFGRFNVNFSNRNPAALNSPTFSFAGTGQGSPTISSVGLSSLFPQGRLFDNYQFQDTIGHTVGNHSLRVGLDILVQRANEAVPINNRGALTFSSNRASASRGVGAFPAFGNFVDQFSGTGAGGASNQFGPGKVQPNTTNQAYFIQDSWRVRPNLTLNLGLRYELYGTPANSVPFPAAQPSFLDPSQPFPVRVEQKRDTNNFAPRFSFAYTPKFGSGFFGKLAGESKTVIRGGFAVNYDVLFNNIIDNITAASPSTFGATNLGASVGGRGFANFRNDPSFLPQSGNPSKLAAENPIEANLQNPVEYVWNFGIQREMPFGMIVDAAYVGSRGIHQFINVEENPGIGGFGTLTRVNPAFGSVLARTNAGDSNYHSLQIRAERGFKNGFLFRAAYTFSKAIDDVNSEVFTTSGGSTRPSDPLSLGGGFRADRSVATFDIPNRFVVVALYDVKSPIHSRVGRAIFGGFTISGTYRIQSGSVESPYVGGIDMNGDGSAFNDRPAISNPNAPPTSVAFLQDFFGAVSPTGYFDINGNPIALSSARYVVDPNIRTGIAARNSLRGPRLSRLDLSLNRSFKLPFMGENTQLQVRFEAFNVLNHPYFAWDHNNADGNVLGNLFNQPTANDGGQFVGTNRVAHFQFRLVF